MVLATVVLLQGVMVRAMVIVNAGEKKVKVIGVGGGGRISGRSGAGNYF